MFTGLISAMGRIGSLSPRGRGAASLTIQGDPWIPPLVLGESIAVQGVCLTVTAATARRFDVDVLQETLDRSNLGKRPIGSRVNLERALRAGDRLGGHFVSGHIDGLATCLRVNRAGPDYAVTLQADRGLLKGLVLKGSVSLDGVSLTVAALSDDQFRVHVIPHTWLATTLQWLRPGDPVNLETDLLGKHAMRTPTVDAPSAATRPSLTLETLRRSGFDV